MMAVGIPPGSSVLIVLMGSVGDVARGLPLVQKIRSQCPGVRITWLVEPKSHAVVTLHSNIDEVLLFHRGGGLSALFEIVRELRSRRFDIALDLQRHFKSGVFSRLSGARRIIGFNRSDAKEFNWLFSTERIRPLGDSIPKIDHYLEFLTHLGLEAGAPLDFGIRSRALSVELPAKFPKASPEKIGLVLGSAWESKDWVAEGYDGLVELLLARTTVTVVLLGDRSKVTLAEKLVAAHRSDRLVSLAGETSLAQLAGVIGNLTALCGPDSGPGHIAAALGVPYVALFGATDPVRTAPYGSEDLVIRSEIGCSPCYQRRCPGLNRLCMRVLSPTAVFGRLQSLITP